MTGATADLDRRTFLSIVVCGVIATPLIVNAQTGTAVRRIGYLGSGAQPSPAELKQYYAPLRELGWIEGQNLIFERRYANDKTEFQSLAEELVRLKVEVILTGGTDATLAAKNATNTIPIVMRSAGDPVRLGLVASLARPGGNVTGYSVAGLELTAKARRGVLSESILAQDCLRRKLPASRRILQTSPPYVSDLSRLAFESTH